MFCLCFWEWIFLCNWESFFWRITYFSLLVRYIVNISFESSPFSLFTRSLKHFPWLLFIMLCWRCLFYKYTEHKKCLNKVITDYYCRQIFYVALSCYHLGTPLNWKSKREKMKKEKNCYLCSWVIWVQSNSISVAS